MIMLSQAYRIASAKRTFVTRRVPLELMQSLVGGNGASKPKSGDLVLAKIVQVGHHKFGERTDGRRAALFEGDEIILAYGHRYAPDQFEAVVPGSLEECHLVAAGGIAAQAISWHSKTKSPTVIQPVGLIADYSGKIINVSDFAVDETNLVDLVPSVACWYFYERRQNDFCRAHHQRSEQGRLSCWRDEGDGNWGRRRPLVNERLRCLYCA